MGFVSESVVLNKIVAGIWFSINLSTRFLVKGYLIGLLTIHFEYYKSRIIYVERYTQSRIRWHRRFLIKIIQSRIWFPLA